MSYTKSEWQKGDVITSAKLNNIENGISAISDAVTSIDTTVSEIKKSVDGVNTSVQTNASSIEGINTKLTAINSAITSVLNVVTDLPGRISIVEDQVHTLKTANSTVVTDVSAGYNDTTVDAVVKDVAIPAGVTKIAAKSVDLASSTIDSAHVTVDAAEDITLTDVVTFGKLAKSVSNSGISINNNGYVTIRNCDFSQTGYNTLEIGLTNAAPKAVTIEDCNFGDTANNSILIFNTQPNAVINIKNCTFGNVSQVLRLSNKDNVSGIVVNLINCSVKSTDKNLSWPMILLQDYQKGTGADIKAANRFAKEKITINIIGCKKGGKDILPVEDLATICNSQDENGLFVVYNNYERSTVATEAIDGIVDYGDGSRYPTINIK